MEVATFGAMVFSVSSDRIYTLSELSVEESLDTEAQENQGAKPSTYIKGMELMPVSFALVLDSRFVAVTEELDRWFTLLRQRQPYYLTLGGRLVSRNRFLLKSVKAGEFRLAGGKLLHARLDLSFEEYVSAGYKKDAGGAVLGTGAGQSAKTTKKQGTAKGNDLNLSAEAMKIVEQARKGD